MTPFNDDGGDVMTENEGVPLWKDRPTAELRERASRTGIAKIGWNNWTHEMLVAFFTNRHGKHVVTEGETACSS